MTKRVSIIGAGLAGSEAALQLACRGYSVILFDAKPQCKLPVYELSTFAELVCNNSLSPNRNDTPLGLLVSELREMGSRLIKIADNCRVDDSAYLAVDKKSFSMAVTKELIAKGVELINDNVESLPDVETVILASGPLTNERLLGNVSTRYHISGYHFSDASSTIIDISSIDLTNRYITKITDDLYAVEIPEDVFSAFCDALREREASTKVHEADEYADFDKCMSLERLALQDNMSLKRARFTHPYQDGNCLLLRRENALENGFIMVGCMTTLRHVDQKSVFSMLPGFSNVRIIKYGRMHRNTFFDAPRILDQFYKVKNENLYIVGQLSGTDGYAPAIASGLVATWRIIYGEKLKPFPKDTMIGSLARYVSNQTVTDYQPMCASFSLMSGYHSPDECIRASQTAVEQYLAYIDNSMRETHD